MKLNYHLITEEEKHIVCSWKYEGEYACYNQPPYEEIKEKGVMFCNPKNKNNFRAFYDGDMLVGFTNLKEEEKEVFLGIAVAPNLRSKGYGTAIIQETCHISEELYPNKPIYLTVRTWNQWAKRCYEKAGFVVDGPVIKVPTYSGEAEFYRMVLSSSAR